jgi:hypothetical protein
LDIEPHSFVDIGPIVHRRIRVVPHDLVPNGVP